MFSMFCVSLFSCHLADKDGHSLVIALYSGRILSLVGQGNLGKNQTNYFPLPFKLVKITLIKFLLC